MTKHTSWTIGIALVFLAITSSVSAQNEPLRTDNTHQELNASETIQPQQKTALPGPSKKRPLPKGQISLNFDDADINAVMQTVLGNLLKVNYLIDPRVRGSITFRSIAPVPYHEILPVMEVILRLNGIAIVENSGIYRVIPISDISRESGSVHFGRSPDNVDLSGKGLIQVVQIHFGASSEIARLISPFVSTNAVVIDVPKNNQIVLVDTPANIKRLLGLINIFDSEDAKKKSPQVYVYNVQNSKAKDIVRLLQQIFTSRHSSADEAFVQRMMEEQTSDHGPAMETIITKPAGSVIISELTKIFADELTNTVIILGTPQDYEIISQTIKTIDVVPRQVVIEGIVAQINLTDDLNLGLSAAINTNISTLGIKLGLNTANLAPSKIPGQGFTFVGTDNTGVVRAVVSALAVDSKAKLLASPHILVSDNREARIQVGQSVPLVTSETLPQVGIAPQRTIQYKDIGIILKVKPRINDSGLVSMDIVQEISTYGTVKLYNAEDQIILQKTEASTSLVVQDGQTIIIGGLIREDKSDSKSGLPFLSKIPVLGYLFGESAIKKSRSEIIILLTPHVLKNQQNTADVTSRYVEKFTGKGASQDIKKEDLMIDLKPFGPAKIDKSQGDN
ncbi:MAG: secretin N-terminal domain-containing protein [Smithellaceae bacterium]